MPISTFIFVCLGIGTVTSKLMKIIIYLDRTQQPRRAR